MLGIYCRISREKEEGKDRSINDQKLLGIELADKLNIAHKIYIDEGVSGTLPIDKRPAFNDLITDVISDLITKIYVYDQSRLERSPEVRFTVNKLFKEKNIEVYTQKGLVTHDIESEFAGDLMSVINNFQTKITSEKIQSVLKRNASEGKVHGITAYGYTKDEKGYMIIDEEESKIIKRIFNDSLSGVGTNKIAETLTNKGVPTRYNKIGKGTLTTTDRISGTVRTKEKKDIIWSGNTIRNIIVNPIYKGERNTKSGIYKSPIIITPSLWKKVNKNLKNNSNTNSGRKVKHNYLLRGKLICGKCGRNYYGRKRVSKKDNYYMCSSRRYKKDNCGNRGINIDVLEDFIWQRFFVDKVLKNKIQEELLNKDNSERISYNKIELREFEHKLKESSKMSDRAVQLALKGQLLDEELESSIKKIREEKEKLVIIISNLKEDIKSLENMGKTSSKMIKELDNIKQRTSFKRKKEIINKYIKNIEIFYFFISKEISFYNLIITYNNINLMSEVFTLDKQYNFAFNIYDKIIIPLSNKIKSEHDSNSKILLNRFEKILGEEFERLDKLFTKSEWINLTKFKKVRADLIKESLKNNQK